MGFSTILFLNFFDIVFEKDNKNTMGVSKNEFIFKIINIIICKRRCVAIFYPFFLSNIMRENDIRYA